MVPYLRVRIKIYCFQETPADDCEDFLVIPGGRYEEETSQRGSIVTSIPIYQTWKNTDSRFRFNNNIKNSHVLLYLVRIKAEMKSKLSSAYTCMFLLTLTDSSSCSNCNRDVTGNAGMKSCIHFPWTLLGVYDGKTCRPSSKRSSGS